MADDNPTSLTRKRLAKKRDSRKQDPDPPEVALARNLIKTEYGLREPSPGSEAPTRDAENAWAQLAEELRRFMDRLRGRSASAGGAPSSANGQEAGSFAQAQPSPARAMRAEPPQQPPSAQSVSAGKEGFQAAISQLPPRALKAFEDAVLKQVRSEEKWKEAYDESATSMPSVAMYANNAYLRELTPDAPADAAPRAVTATRTTPRAETTTVGAEQSQAIRNRWARPPQDSPMHNADQRSDRALDPQQPAPLSSRSEFAYPSLDDMSNAQQFGVAERTSQAIQDWSDTNSRNPGLHPMSDGYAFLSAGVREQLRINNALSAAPASPVSPISGTASPALPTVQPLLSREGYDVIHNTVAPPRAPSAAGKDSPSHSAVPVRSARTTRNSPRGPGKG